MRQVVKLLKVIGKADLVDFYHSLLSYATVQGAKLPSLTEFLALSLNESGESVSDFDLEADKILEAQALKSFNERQKQHGE